MRVSGVKNWMVSPCPVPNERTPWIWSLSILDILTAVISVYYRRAASSAPRRAVEIVLEMIACEPKPCRRVFLATVLSDTVCECVGKIRDDGWYAGACHACYTPVSCQVETRRRQKHAVTCAASNLPASHLARKRTNTVIIRASVSLSPRAELLRGGPLPDMDGSLTTPLALRRDLPLMHPLVDGAHRNAIASRHYFYSWFGLKLQHSSSAAVSHVSAPWRHAGPA